jgi:hypothetical protein
MIDRLINSIRIYFAEAWLSYQGRFAITSPFGYIASKLGFPFFLMLFFIFMSKYVGFSDPVYIVIGNILLIPAASGIPRLYRYRQYLAYPRREWHGRGDPGHRG